MCSAGDSAALPTLGFPIRESTGQRLFSASPWLIAAVHALPRLLVPRHPPCALTILTVISPPRRQHPFGRGRSWRAGDTRFQPPLIVAADVASVQFSRTVKRLLRRPVRVSLRAAPRPADVGLSKLNSILDLMKPEPLALPK